MLGRGPGDLFGASRGPWPSCRWALQEDGQTQGCLRSTGVNGKHLPAATGAAAHRVCDLLWDAGAGDTWGRQDCYGLFGRREGLEGGGTSMGKRHKRAQFWGGNGS